MQSHRSHLVVSRQRGHMQGSEGAAAQLLHIWPPMKKCGHQLRIILTFQKK